MALWFRIQRMKASIRIAVERMQQKKTTTGKVAYDYISLGGITDKKMPEAIKKIMAKLDEDEKVQLHNYLHNRDFIRRHFNTDMDNVTREFIYFNPDFYQALYKLSKLAAKHDMPFYHTEVALNAILTKAKAVERKLNSLLGKRINVLEKLGIPVD